MIRGCMILLTWMCTVQGKIGYFWHITDIHYNPKYTAQGDVASMCWTARNDMGSGMRMRVDHRLAGTFGDYNCDSPWALIESAARAMKAKHGENIEFVLWTGDALSHTASTNDQMRLQYLKNLTDLLSHTFTSQFVFPALGHEDMGLELSQIANLWKHWLPSEALVTFSKSGYYTIEQRSKKYRIIVLNTNLWLNNGANFGHRKSLHGNGAASDRLKDPFVQWSWLETVLLKARIKQEKVYLVGHTAPGVDEREGGMGALLEEHNKRYLRLVRQYADIIGGQFFGHWHSDTFRIVYSDTGNPVSWMMMAPSITPGRPGGPNNPGLRLYKFDTNTGQVLDYTQYYLNLPDANAAGRASWVAEYSLLEHYELKEITPVTLHDLADRLTQPNDYAFIRYYAANTVSLPREVEEIWGCGGALNGACALQHYCAVTRLNPESYRDCLASYAYALASVATPVALKPTVPPSFYPLITLSTTFLCIR